MAKITLRAWQRPFLVELDLLELQCIKDYTVLVSYSPRETNSLRINVLLPMLCADCTVYRTTSRTINCRQRYYMYNSSRSSDSLGTVGTMPMASDNELHRDLHV